MFDMYPTVILPGPHVLSIGDRQFSESGANPSVTQPQDTGDAVPLMARQIMRHCLQQYTCITLVFSCGSVSILSRRWRVSKFIPDW